MPVVSEVMDVTQLPLMLDYVDVLQIGARNMHNFSLLREVAKTNRPVVLKRGFGATLEEWLLAAEYLLDGGNDQVILCERGIRSFDNTLRNTLDLAGMAWVKERSRLPVIVDPSHSTGRALAGDPHGAGGGGGRGRRHHGRGAPHPRDRAVRRAPRRSPRRCSAQLMQTLPALLQATGRTLAHPEALAAVGGTAR